MTAGDAMRTGSGGEADRGAGPEARAVSRNVDVLQAVAMALEGSVVPEIAALRYAGDRLVQELGPAYPGRAAPAGLGGGGQEGIPRPAPAPRRGGRVTVPLHAGETIGLLRSIPAQAA